MTPYFRNPLLWLRRFRHRCGYGVHSPFAFGFLCSVVYEKWPYYAFAELDKHLTYLQRFRVRRYLHLLFRLANYHQPSSIVCFGGEEMELAFLRAGRRKAEFAVWQQGECRTISAEAYEDSGKTAKHLLFLTEPHDEVLPFLTSQSMLLLANVHQYKDWWYSLPKVVSFDLYDIGIAFFDKKLNKQEYIVNF